MNHNEILSGFKKACDDLGINYIEDVNLEEVSFKKRSSSSEGTFWFTGSVVKSSDQKSSIICVRGGLHDYYGDNLEKAVDALREGKLFFQTLN